MIYTDDLHQQYGEDFPFIFGSEIPVADCKHGSACEVQRVDVTIDKGLVEALDILGPV